MTDSGFGEWVDTATRSRQIAATRRARLAIVCQTFVGACQPERGNVGAKAPDGTGPDAPRLGALPTATGGLARFACAHARQNGVALAPLLIEAGLTEEQIADRGARLSVDHQIRFLNLVADAVADADFGFHLALVPDLRELGLLYYVAASSGSLRDALWRTARYCGVANEGLALAYREDGAIEIAFDYAGVPRRLDRHQMESCITLVMRLCRQLTGRRVAASRVTLAHHRGDHNGEMAAFFGCDVTFGASVDCLTLAADAGDIPVVSADPYLNRLLLANCEEALARRPTQQGSLRAAVENAIAPLLPHGKVKAGDIAGKLGLSQRTFARRLASEGLTFSEVLERLRGDLGRQYLADPGLSISQVAWLLGYQEVSAFTHAFKRWTGKSPRDIRAARTPARRSLTSPDTRGSRTG
jgi:AraC-like DNA-binding protein